MQMVPTAELRFVRRLMPVPGNPHVGQAQTILQQKWVAYLYSAQVLIVNPNQYDDWRDVPLVEESADASR